jgi:hypothetical protein
MLILGFDIYFRVGKSHCLKGHCGLRLIVGPAGEATASQWEAPAILVVMRERYDLVMIVSVWLNLSLNY